MMTLEQRVAQLERGVLEMRVAGLEKTVAELEGRAPEQLKMKHFTITSKESLTPEEIARRMSETSRQLVGQL